MRKYDQLSPRQRIIISALVNKSYQGYGDEFQWEFIRAMPMVGFGGQFAFYAESKDLQTIARCGFIDFSISREGNSGAVRLKDAAFLAFEKRFGMDKRQFILEAAHVASFGVAEKWFYCHSIESTTGQSRADIEAQMKEFEAENLANVGRLFTAEAGRCYSLTRLGAATVLERDEIIKEIHPMPHTTNNVTNNAPVSIQSFGNDNQFIQHNNPQLREIIDLLDATKDHLSELPKFHREQADEQIELIKAEVKTGHPNLERIKTAMGATVVFSAGLAKVVTALAVVGDKLGIDKQTIEHLFHSVMAK
jgi:hypothetical protein